MSTNATSLAVTLALASLLLAPLPASHAAERPAAGRPNLLFLITDQQTAGALSCEGNPYVKTPNLDRLAARGMRFEKSYCTYPLCCPSRGSLFTSRMPHELGIYGNFGAELSEKGVPTMGNLIADVSLAEEIERHRGLLKQWMEDTHDAFGKAPARGRRNQRRLPRRTPPKNTTPFRSNPR